MKNLILTGIIAVSIITLFSCKKSDEVVVPSATISIVEPMLNQIYHQGDTVHIMATINGNTTLHGYDATIVNTANGDTLFNADDHTHATLFDVHEMWVDTFSTAADLRLYIFATINHDGLQESKSVDFKVQP